jgi:sulfur-carrier protein
MLAATLRKYVPGYDGTAGHALEAAPGATVRDVARLAGIPEEEVKIIMVDGVGAKWDTALKGHERVALFPAVGGG